MDRKPEPTSLSDDQLDNAQGGLAALKFIDSSSPITPPGYRADPRRTGPQGVGTGDPTSTT